MDEAMRQRVLIAIALVVAVAWVYLPVRNYPLISYDDPLYVSDPHVQAGLTISNVGWAMTTFAAANWHPVTWLSLMLDRTLYGDHSGGFHLTNVAVHAINAVLFFVLFVVMTQATWRSAIVAALFALHPMRVGSVAWISERKGLLAVMFTLLCLLAYVRQVRAKDGRHGWMAVVMITAALAMMSKAAAVTIPFVLLLLDVWPLERVRGVRVGRLLYEKTGVFLIAAADCILTYSAQLAGGGVVRSTPHPLMLRLGNALLAYGRYILLTVFPRGLTVFYPYEGALPGTSLPLGRVCWAAATLALLIALAVGWWKRSRAPAVGLLWFLGCLVPMIGVIQVGQQSMADRYSYFPQIGLFFGAVFAFETIERSKIGLAFCAVVVIAFALRSRAELWYWRDDLTLFSHALEVTDHNAVAHESLGVMLSKETATIPEAERQYRIALSIEPRDPMAQMNLANLLQDTGRLNEAMEHYQTAIEIAPQNGMVRYNMGLALARNGREKEAVGVLSEAARLAPEIDDVHYTLGLALLHTGETSRGVAELQRARALAVEQGHAGLVTQIDGLISPP